MAAFAAPAKPKLPMAAAILKASVLFFMKTPVEKLISAS
jgi:hypothetical protein